jgi:hypothetical protein
MGISMPKVFWFWRRGKGQSCTQWMPLGLTATKSPLLGSKIPLRVISIEMFAGFVKDGMSRSLNYRFPNLKKDYSSIFTLILRSMSRD